MESPALALAYDEEKGGDYLHLFLLYYIILSL